ncbi:MAG: winged helix-turn-helix domain-containing protein [Nanoarchaeota archaeon]
MDYIHLCNFPKNKIYLLLKKDYRMDLINKSIKKLGCKNYFELSLWINKNSRTKFNGGDIKYWIEGNKLDKRTGKTHPKFMPLWLVLKLLSLTKLGEDELDRNTLYYRSGGKGLIITLPLLPLVVSPELDSIVVHLFGDGAAGDFTPSYTQKNKVQTDNFIKKLENCFGNFEKSEYVTQGKYQVKFPKAITDILSYYYSIKSYKSYESKIPNIILNSADKKRKLACIIAFIVDEGGIRDVVSLYSVNYSLLNGMRRLILDCGYGCSEIKKNKKTRSYLFNICNRDIERLYADFKRISKEFPTCNLSFKEEELGFIIKRRKNSNPKDMQITRKRILDSIKNNQFSARQISNIIGYAYCTVIHNLEKLYKENKLKRVRVKNKTYLWGLPK